MADRDMRALLRAAKEDPAQRGAYLAALLRADTAFAAVEEQVVALLARVREGHADVPELDPGRLVKLIDVASLDDWAYARLHVDPTVIALLLVQGPELVMGVGVWPGDVELKRSWPSLRGARLTGPDTGMARFELAEWADEDADLRIPMSAAEHWMKARWELQDRPAPVGPPADAPRPSRQQLARLQALRKRADLEDDRRFVSLLRDEGWMHDLESLTAPWASIAIDVLEERLGERFDMLPEQPVFLAEEGGPTEKQLDYLCALKAKHALDDDAFRELAAEAGYVWTFDRLTKEWASVLIDRLKSR